MDGIQVLTNKKKILSSIYKPFNSSYTVNCMFNIKFDIPNSGCVLFNIQIPDITYNKHIVLIVYISITE